MSRATLLLPGFAAFGRQRIGSDIAAALGCADEDAFDAGRRPQLLRQFTLTPWHWPPAALTREMDAGDAAGACWLRADPAHVRPDINGARLLAYGDALALTEEDRVALLPALKPVFGDAGFVLDAPTPSRWYLRLSPGAQLPVFTEPADALGDDLFDHLAEGRMGRRWRALLNEAQVVLHNHPWNLRRAAQGKPAINSLWFWGGGMLPDMIGSRQTTVRSDDDLLQALAAGADAALEPLPQRFEGAAGAELFDLRHARDLAQLQHAWLQPALAALRRGTLRHLELDCDDGHVFQLRRGQRWRFWRKPFSMPTQ